MRDLTRRGKRAYDYGHHGQAARRLRMSAEAFSASSRRFLSTVLDRPVRLALDLGCGPGYSTKLLAEVSRPRQTIGLDTLEPFLSLARSGAPDGVSFINHDVTKVPFPIGPADLIYCRFLLGYLDEPETLVSQWGSELLPGGLLLMEEVEWISTTNPVIGRYFEMLSSMLAHQGHRYIGLAHRRDELRVEGFGAVLGRIPETAALRRRLSQTSNVSRTAGPVSRGFLVHVQEVMQHDPFLASTQGEEALGLLASDLAALAVGSDRRREVYWTLRQVAFERA